MAQAFSRDPRNDSHIIGFLDDVERSVVIELMHQTSVLLSDGSEEPADDVTSTGQDDLFVSLSRSMEHREAPTDPALRRLLPDGVKGDDDAAAEFRRLTEASLRDRKLRNLDIAMKAFERQFVDDEQVAAIADEVYDAATDPGAEPRPRPRRGDATEGSEAAGEHVSTHPRDDGDGQADPDDLADGLNDGAREVVLSETEARATMMALSDVRLVLAERIGLRTDEDAEALHRKLEGMEAPTSSQELIAAYYDFLTWLAESVTLAVLRQA